MLDVLKKGIKVALGTYRHRRREAELKRDQRHVTSGQIAQDLKSMGIAQGDTLFIHSSLKSLGFVEGGPDAVIRGLLDAVGPEGTLILPTYYLPGGTILGTCQMPGYVFDPRVLGSNMGALPQAFLRFPGVERSIHPTHSVSSLGKHAKYLTEFHHRAPSIFGKGSPWQRFHDLNGKVLGLGVSLGPVTFYHLLEDSLGDQFPVNVWIDKTYQLPCKGWQGEDYAVPVRPYRSELMPMRIDHPSRNDLREFMRQHLVECEALQLGVVGTAQAWSIAADEFFENLRGLADRGITIYSPLDQVSVARGTSFR